MKSSDTPTGDPAFKFNPNLPQPSSNTGKPITTEAAPGSQGGGNLAGAPAAQSDHPVVHRPKASHAPYKP